MGLDGTNESGPRRLIRRLRLLGHLETNEGGTRWSVTPTVLARLNLDANDDATRATFAVCGARDQGLVTAIGAFGTTRTERQPSGSGPSVVLVESKPDDLTRGLLALGLSERVRVADQPALVLARALPRIEDWLVTLPQLPNISPEMYDIAFFDGHAFVDMVFNGRAGMYQFRRLGPMGREHRQQVAYTLYYDSTLSRWVRGDWYGLRYLGRLQSGQACPIGFDAARRRLVVPRKWRWPELFERTLVLSSGRLPTLSSDTNALVYSDISLELVELLTQKLHLQQGPLKHA